MKNWLSGTISGAIILGIIISALWENFFKLPTNLLLNILVSVTTFGFKGFQKSIYTSIATGLHEDADLRVMVFMYSILLAFITVTVLFHFLSPKLKDNEEVFESRFYLFLKAILRNKIFITFFLVIAFVFFALDMSRVIFINQSITYFEQLRKIDLPYMTDDDVKKIDSTFAQIQDSADYDNVTGTLELTARIHNTVVPLKPTVIRAINYPGIF